MSDLRTNHSSLMGHRVVVTLLFLRNSKYLAGHHLPAMKVEVD